MPGSRARWILSTAAFSAISITIGNPAVLNGKDWSFKLARLELLLNPQIFDERYRRAYDAAEHGFAISRRLCGTEKDVVGSTCFTEMENQDTPKSICTALPAELKPVLRIII